MEGAKREALDNRGRERKRERAGSTNGDAWLSCLNKNEAGVRRDSSFFSRSRRLPRSLAHTALSSFFSGGPQRSAHLLFFGRWPQVSPTCAWEKKKILFFFLRRTLVRLDLLVIQMSNCLRASKVKCFSKKIVHASTPQAAVCPLLLLAVHSVARQSRNVNVKHVLYLQTK